MPATALRVKCRYWKSPGARSSGSAIDRPGGYGCSLTIGLPLLAYAAFFLCLAHLARWAAATLLRPSADIVRFFVGDDFTLLVDPGGLPRLLGPLSSVKSARALCSRAISSSKVESISSVVICPLE
jgi:hypothetical protein